jgi:3-methylfumaryl-CoA hydratase
MWAGGEIDFLNPILIDSTIEKTVRVTDIQTKSSKKYDDMIFLTRESTLSSENSSPLVVEKTNHVYLKGNERYSPPLKPVVLDPHEFEWQRVVRADPVSLFRFSALTWNSHRIHYDLEHTRNVEGYPDLVVHGPILSMLMLDSFQEVNSWSQYRYKYRGVQPLFVTSSINIVGRRDDTSSYKFYALNDSNEVCMESTVTLI